MARPFTFAVNEWYHCYNRGVDKRRVYLDTKDYDRFLALLYLSNNSAPVHLDNFSLPTTSRSFLRRIFTIERGEPLIDIGAYCLMPNHFHIVARERTEGGIALFMQKVGTGYTMYFNKRQDRTGALFQGRFKAQHVSDDRYLKRLIDYVHVNPAEICEPRWKEGVIRNPKKTAEFLRSYEYSSLPGYLNSSIEHDPIPNAPLVREFYEQFPSMNDLLENAQTFAKDMEERQ